jgi:hypothetical protein
MLSALRRKDLYAWVDQHLKLSTKRASNVLLPWRIAFEAAMDSGAQARDCPLPEAVSNPFATMMLMAGENPLWVAKQMGHTDAALTLKRYARWIAFDMPGAGSKVQRFDTSWSPRDANQL